MTSGEWGGDPAVSAAQGARRLGVPAVDEREPRSGTVAANGVRLHYLDWAGDAPQTILCLHGGSANARVAESLALVREQFADIAENAISEAELEAAKTFITGSFPLSLNSNARIARTLVVLQDFDLGIDYLDRRAGIIDAVTTGDIRRMADRLFDSGNMLTVIVGDPEGVEGREIEVGG